MTGRKNSWLRFLPAVALLGGASIFLHARSGPERLPPREELASFPLKVGDWTGTDLGIQPNVREVLGDGDFLQRIYQRHPSEPYIDLFLAFFPTQRTGSTIHSPQNCLPGAGWVPLESSRLEFSSPDGRTIIINRYVIGKGLDRQLVLYWYEAHGRVIASEYWAKFYLVADSIRINRSDGALVRIITPLSEDESVDSGQRRVVEFAQRILPVLDNYIPR